MQIGDFMRTKRQEMGLTIGQVAKDLLIQEKFISALEEGNYEIIPGEVYQRAYFNKYAEYLGLSELIEKAAVQTEKTPEERLQPMDEIFGGTWDNARKIRVGLKIAFIILIPTLIILGFRASANTSGRTAQNEPERVEGTQVLEVIPTDTQSQNWQTPPIDQQTQNPAQLSSLEHRIKLTALGSCWVVLKTRDATLYTGTMVAGDVLNFTDMFGFYLEAGAPEKLEVEFDGELVPWELGQTKMVLPDGASIITN